MSSAEAAAQKAQQEAATHQGESRCALAAACTEKPAPGHCLVWSDDADAPSQTPPFSALMGEVEAVSKAFEQLQEQNVRLLQTIQDKEEAATKLVAERLRADQSMKLLKAERQGLDEKLAAAERLAQD